MGRRASKKKARSRHGARRYELPETGCGKMLGGLAALFVLVPGAVLARTWVEDSTVSTGLLIFVGMYVSGCLWLFGCVLVRRFEVTQEGVWIVHPLRRRLIPGDQIADVSLVEEEKASQPAGMLLYHRCLRSCKVAGVGRVKLYASEWHDMALIKMQSGRLLLIGVHFTPEFVGDVRSIQRPTAEVPAP